MRFDVAEDSGNFLNMLAGVSFRVLDVRVWRARGWTGIELESLNRAVVGYWSDGDENGSSS